MLKNSEEILKKLGLPYRVLEICTGDLADWKFRSADLEVYRPTTKEYGEVMSLSNCTDYQARKLNIKFTDSKGNKRVLHTLNDTALATSRILVAILENNQNKDGSITIPKILVPYMGKNKITRGRIINNFLFPSIFICMAFVSNLKTRPHQNTTGKAAHFEAPI